jgi:hypothetical protein
MIARPLLFWAGMNDAQILAWVGPSLPWEVQVFISLIRNAVRCLVIRLSGIKRCVAGINNKRIKERMKPEKRVSHNLNLSQGIW